MAALRARSRRRRAARSHGRAALPGTLRAVAAGAEPDPRRARTGRAEGRSPPPLAAPGAAPSPPPLGLPTRAERGRMTELQSALLLRRQLAGTWGRRRGKEGRAAGDPPQGAAAGRARRGRGPRRGKEGAPARGGGGRECVCVCEGEGEITAPPRRAVPSREPRELGRAGEGEPGRRSLPGEPGEGSGAGTAGERPLGCPRPAGGAPGGTGRARRPLQRPATEPGALLVPSPCGPVSLGRGESRAGARPAARGMRAG